MTSLQQTPPRARRRLALMLAPMAVVLLAAGILPLVVNSSVTAKVLAGIVGLVGMMLFLVVTGLLRSARLDEREAALDAAILAAAPGCGGDSGSCDSCGADDCAVKSLPRL